MHKQIITAVIGALLVSMVVLESVNHTQTTALSFGAELLAQGQGQGGGQGGGQGNTGGGQGNAGGQGGGQGNTGGSPGNSAFGRSGGRGRRVTPSTIPGTGPRGGGSSGPSGRGLRQHATVLHSILQRSNLHSLPPRRYVLSHPSLHPSAFVSSKKEEEWGEDLHTVTCSVFLYLKQLRESGQMLQSDYVDWITEQVARALDEDIVEVKAALLGYPHRHDHTSALLGDVTESGCERGDTKLTPEELELVGEEHALRAADDTASGTSVNFSVEDTATATGFVLRIRTETGSVFTDFGISHGAEMHIFAVRDDLRHFRHLHPKRDAESTWEIPFAPPAGGTYRFYSDFVDSGMERHVVPFTRTYEGEKGDYGFIRSMQRLRMVNDFRVALESEHYSDGIILTYHINDTRNREPRFDTYYGTLGHALLFSEDGDFIATYSTVVGDHLTFHIPKDLSKIYRIFAMFRVKGVTHTAQFDWIPETEQLRHSRTLPHEH